MLNRLRDLLRQIRMYWAIRRSGLFDREYYLRTYLDVTRSCVDPLKDYILHGWHEGRNPSPAFNTEWYLKTYSDVRRAGINPLYHYILHGAAEKRVCLSDLSENRNVDVSCKTGVSVTEPPLGGIKSNHSRQIVAAKGVYIVSEEELLYRVRKYNAQKPRRKASVVVYTAIIGGYDPLIIPEYITDEWDYVVFSDTNLSGEHIFEIREPNCYNSDPTRMARFIKTHPHYYFPDYDYAVWIDSNILIRGPHLGKCVKECINNNILFMCNPHPKRNCVSEELTKCISLNKDDRASMKSQVAHYQREGFPANSGMLETNILIRKHNDEQLKVFDNMWWNEIEKGSYRDQLSVMYAIWKLKLPYEPLPNMKDVRYHEGNDYCLFPHGGKSGFNPLYVQPSFIRGKNPLRGEIKKQEFSTEHLAPFQNERVDIVTCVHNAIADVKQCLDSVCVSLLPAHRLIIIDDGSDADTQTMLRTFIQKYPQQIKLIRNDKAQGYTKAANVGLRASDAPFVILLNSDTIVPKHWAIKMLQAARSNPYIGIVGPMSNAASWQSLPLVKDPATGRLAVNELPQGKSVQDIDRLCEEKSDYPVFPLVPLVNGFCYGIKPEVFEAIGYFDEFAFPKGYGEEDDFSFRASEAGFIHSIATHCYVYHAKSKSFGGAKRDKLASKGTNTLRLRYGEARVRRAIQTMMDNPLLRRARNGVNAACGSQLGGSISPSELQTENIDSRFLWSAIQACKKRLVSVKNIMLLQNIQKGKCQAIPAEQLEDIESLKSVISNENVGFFDFGCSHGSGILWVQEWTGKIGLGFDTNSQKLDSAANKGVLCTKYDILKLPREKLVSFTTIFHLLEHLESRKQAEAFMRKACIISRDNVFIKQPYFDADPWLFHKGLKTFYSHWTGHKNLMTTPDFYHILEEFRGEGIIQDFIIAYKQLINSTGSNTIHSLASPRDSLHYDVEEHPPKPAGMPLDYAIYYEIMAAFDVNGNSYGRLWDCMSPDFICYDSKTGETKSPFLGNKMVRR